MISVQKLLNMHDRLTSLDIVILDCPSFDDQLLTALAKEMPKTLKEIHLDFNGYAM